MICLRGFYFWATTHEPNIQRKFLFFSASCLVASEVLFESRFECQCHSHTQRKRFVSAWNVIPNFRVNRLERGKNILRTSLMSWWAVSNIHNAVFIVQRKYSPQLIIFLHRVGEIGTFSGTRDCYRMGVVTVLHAIQVNWISCFIVRFVRVSDLFAGQTARHVSIRKICSSRWWSPVVLVAP